MWFIDIFHDHEWLGKINGRLPAETFRTTIGFESDPLLKAELLMFSDVGGPRHFRVLLPTTNTFDGCQHFIAHQLNKIIASVETVISLQIGIGFEIHRPFGTSHVTLGSGEYLVGDEQIAAVINTNIHTKTDFDPSVTGRILTSVQRPGVENYLFNLKRGVDSRLDLDYRWTNYYRICERRFCGNGKVSLQKEMAWEVFLRARIVVVLSLAPDIRHGQTPGGYLEELRAIAMHTNGQSIFGHDQRLERSLPLIRFLATEVINGLIKDGGTKLIAQRADGTAILDHEPGTKAAS